MLTVRCCKIMNDLLTASYPISKKALMEKYHVSDRSIKYDINNLRGWLEDEASNILVQYIQKCGFKLSGSTKDIYELQQLFSKEKEKTRIFSTERTRYIILMLLTSNEFITIQDFSSKLDVSKNTVTRDIDTISDMLAIWDIYLDRKAHWGFKINTTETKRRQAIEYFILSMLDVRSIEEILQGLRQCFLPVFFRKIMCQYLIEEQDVENLCKLCKQLLENIYKMTDVLDDKGSIEVFIRICVALHQIRHKSGIGDLVKFSAISNDTDHFFRIELKKMFGHFNIDIEEAELNWLLLPFTKDNSIKTTIDIEKITLQIIQKTSHSTKIPFSADCELYENLLMHIKRAFVKKQYHMVNVNPLLDDILHHFGQLFNVVKQICYDVFGRYNIYLRDEEISYIVLYFQLSYETLFGKERIRTIVVCSTGISSAKLLMVQLKNKFDVLQIVGCCSILHAEKFIAHNPIDLIISVLPMQTETPCIVVNAFLQKDDIKKIQSVLDNFKLTPSVTRNLKKAEPKIGSNWHGADFSDMAKIEKFTQEVISKGFNLTMALKESLGMYLTRQSETGLMFHCLLMANRFACGAPYANIVDAGNDTVKIIKVKEKIREAVSNYYEDVPDSEIIAILNYFTLNQKFHKKE